MLSRGAPVPGAGPYQRTDVVEGSSWTFEKVDDYWGFDPKYPDNRLPYADTVEYAIVNDPAAITALLRSGQADIMGFGLNSHLTSVDSAVNLQKTNPDLVLHPSAYRSETAIFWNVQQPPFDDFRVRRAISMAIDFDAIAENYMQGWGDASPSGPIGIYSAVRQDTIGDYVGRSFVIFGLATPNFWLAKQLSRRGE